MGGVFIGSEAVAGGVLTRHELRRWHRTVHPDIYVETRRVLTLREHIAAAWLWSKRRAVIAGVAASALHGARWVADDIAVELVASNGRPPPGLIVRNERLLDGEVTCLDGFPVTTAARTAFDIGRHLPRDRAVARLDALAAATGLDAAEVRGLAAGHKGARGFRRMTAAVELMNSGAQSPKETWLRLLLVDSGLPAPQAQIMVHNGDHYPLAYLDLGWREFMVAVEYDGDQHRSDRRQYVKDRSRLRMLTERGWIVVRVIAEDHPLDVVARVRAALASRGFAEIETSHARTRTFAA